MTAPGRPPPSAGAANGGRRAVSVAPAFRASFPALPDSVSGARWSLIGWLRTCQADDWHLDDVALAVTEACTNVVLHAYRDQPPGLIDVHAVIADHELTVSVLDDGVGMTPRPDSPGLGLGLPLISTLTEAAEFDATANGTTVRLTFVPGPPRAS